MKLAFGMKVISADNQEIGEIKEVVVEPHTRSVTHVVIKEGLLFENDRLIPVSHIVDASGDELTLATSAEQLRESTSDYQEEAFAVVSGREDELRQRIWTHPPSTPMSLVPPGMVPGELSPDIEIPINDIALVHGTNVQSCDGEVIGTVDELFTDQNETITHIVVKVGTVYAERKLIPLAWVAEMADNDVSLAVEKTVVQQLRNYDET